MDPTRFDSLSRILAAVGSRRALTLALSGALVPLIGPGETEARNKLKKCKKIDNKKRRKKCIKRAKGDDECQDGKKNGSETDVDCGGGKCPRCQGGQICNSRNDCHTALCTGGTCQSCAGNCGNENDGVTPCACRDNALKPGEKVCTRQDCDFFMGGTCALCAAGDQCTPAGGGIECCKPCGTL